MKLELIALGALVVARTGAFPVFASSQGSNSTPDGALAAFSKAFNNKDFSAMAALVVGGKPKADYSQLAKMAAGHWPTLAFSNVKPVITGSTASVTYHLIASEASTPKPFEVDETTTMSLLSGGWLIVPADMNGTTAQTHPSGLAMFAASLTNPESATTARSSAQGTVCLSNVKQIALGLLMYASDNDNAFKFRAADARKAIAPYLKNESLWKCPTDSTGGPSYTLNPNLIGVPMAKVTNPASVVMVYEGAGGKLAFRHGGRAAVAYMDGHAKMIDQTAAKSLVWLAATSK